MAYLSKAMKSPIRLFVAISVSISLTLSTQIGANAGDGILFISSDRLDGYDRARFKLWVDADKNGCDTRAEVLIAEAIVKPKKAAKCKLTGGKWLSSYDGIKYTNASKLDIDHLVPLAEAWRSGAWAWTDQQRMEYANNLEDEWALNAVTASVNRSKGDKDISKWLPKKNVCSYLVGWVIIKAKFELTVDTAEAEVINKYYKSCGLGYQTKQLDGVSPAPTATPSQSATPTATATPTPTPTATPTPTPTATPIPTPTATPTPTPSATKVKPAPVKYKNCTEAKAAGVTPIRRATDPELYALNTALDGDKDGDACEN
jgi:hypothetical protein